MLCLLRQNLVAQDEIYSLEFQSNFKNVQKHLKKNFMHFVVRSLSSLLVQGKLSKQYRFL